MALQNRQVARIAGLAESAIEKRAQHGPFERLLDVPERSRFDSGDGAFFASFSGDDNGGDALEVRAELFQEVEAIHAGKLDVGDESVRLIAGEFGENFFRGTNTQNVIAPALEQLLVTFARVVLVLDNENAVFAFQGFDGPHGRTSVFRHGYQPLGGLL